MSGVEIARAGPLDAFDLIGLLRDFHASRPMPVDFDPVCVSRTVSQSIADPRRLALVLRVDGRARGLLLAAAFVSPFAPVLLAQELAWWIAPDHRGRAARQMLQAYEDWARETGCAAIAVASLGGQALARFYQIAGFEPAETYYTKKVV